uniref:Putative capsid protein n=1 Tax=Alternaria solani chrysovirus 1 TaxID=2870620 RepID=A0A8K1JY67_9VIRU|nr:putative capsid protein [Alternaria solani chrysovirus 1]
MDKFNAKKYDRRQAMYMAVRQGAPALQNAVKSADKLEHWDPNNLPNKLKDNKEMLFKGLGNVEAYMERYSASSLDALSDEDTSFGYSIFGDIKRNVMLGANTVGIDVKVNWGNTEVEAETYNGENRKMIVSTNTIAVRSDEGKDLAALSKATGWDRTECYKMQPSQVQTLVTLVDAARAGYNKYTRLVKGMLVYLDLLHNGKQSIRKRIPHMIQYEMNEVLDSYQHRERSYIFCSNADSPEYRVVLSLMSEEYPNQDMLTYGVASIPADGIRNYLVVKGTVGRTVNYTVELTSQMVMASITQYAIESGIADEMESALVTATSLYHNRYLGKVGLPRVVSTIDLIMPMFKPATGVRCARPSITPELATSIGKLHQMCMFLTIKDILIAARSTTKFGFNYSSVVENYLTTQEEVVNVMNDSVTPLKLLDMTPQMKWMYKIDAYAMQDLDSMSMFEVLWLCDGGVTSVRNGGIMAFKKGVSDMMSDNPYHEILTKELSKTNIVFDFSKLPRGNFTIAARYIRDSVERKVKKIEYVTTEVQIARECDYNPQDRVETIVNRRIRVPLSARKEHMLGAKVAWEEHSDSEEPQRPTGKASDETTSVFSSERARSVSPGLSFQSPVSEKRMQATVGLRSSEWKIPPFRRISVAAATKREQRLSSSSSRSGEVRLERGSPNRRRGRPKSPVTAVMRDRSIGSVISAHMKEERKKSATAAEVIEAAVRHAEEEKRNVEKEAKEEEEKITVTVEKMQGAKSTMEMGIENDTDDAAMAEVGLEKFNTVCGKNAEQMYEKLRSKFGVEEVQPRELARFMYILKGTRQKLNVHALTVDDIKHVVSVRDAYDRGYRSSQSGHNRLFREDDGKVLSMEINMRGGRGEKFDPTGVFDPKVVQRLGREFFMVEHERKMILGGN